MLFNFIFYFAIPWIFGIILYRKNSRLFLTIFPFSSMLAFIINTLGIYMGYWSFYPSENSYLNSILLNLGLYPIVGTYFAYLVHNKKVNIYVLIATFSVVVTILKYVLLLMGRAIYGNGWNIFLTFVSFLISYLIGYIFYLALKKKNIIID